jgi:RNA polymerase sigma-70 factor (ECF subfamily)
MTNIQFSNLYNTHYQALVNFAKKLTNDMYEAEDLVQETAIKAYRGMHTFKLGTSFKSWAFTILKNTFINQYHRKKKRSVVNKPVEDFTYALENKFAIRNDALSKLRVKELKNQIHDLSEKSKKPFLMHIKGYQYNEISDQLSIPMGTVKSRINFARTKLKKALSKAS